ncbi:DUF1611 domain-containing protein [Streptomyces sp. GESEQ-4]|uniref:DUF1611 domain-containing protein n=1 Tax=Streptomyces sp. GESEQ-4 TaxID=2812655 RepID=UPI001B343A13|nr:DUF1611 domain-containing protein [Streptomyces sp. GESEQ-4]
MKHHKRIAVLVEGEWGARPSKTLTGMLRYRSQDVVTVIESSYAGQDAAQVLGVDAPHPIPVVADLEAAMRHEPDALLLADEPVGSAIDPFWHRQVLAALGRGLDVISGLHYQLAQDKEAVAAAAGTGAHIWDVRRPPQELYFTDFTAEGRPVVNYRPHRSGTRTVLAVGTDCSSGKMTTMLELAGEATARGLAPGFVATGQVGMMISGGGVAVDTVMADFVNSVVEHHVFHTAQEHDLVLVEGQGAVNHPRYSAVTLGLLHGARPDALILCHELGRTSVGLLPQHPLPSLERAIEINHQAAQWVWPEDGCRVVGISVMSHRLCDDEARTAIDRIEQETGLPTTDVLRYGANRLLDAALAVPVA